jgi:cell division protein FtsQ
MMKKLLNILTWIGIAAWFVVILGFVSSEADQVLCNHIEVVWSDTTKSMFVTASDIREMFREKGLQLQGYPLARINTRELERILEEDTYIKKAEVSTDVSGRMEIWLEQRVPMVRVMPDGREGYYLDKEGKVLPLSDKFIPYVFLVSGHINKGSEGSTAGKQLEEILRFCSYVTEHPFWKEQIVQLYVDRQGEYELIPRVGAHQILLGSMEQWEKKLHNLELLYEQGFSAYGGWNGYSTINLKYTNQVICTKR